MKISLYCGHGYLTLYRKIIKKWRKHIIGMFIHEECYIVIVKTFHRQNVLLYVYLMHTGSRWNTSHNARHFFVILIDFSDECFPPYMNAIIQIGINKCIVQGYQCFIADDLSRFKYYANTFCYFLIDIHYMRWPVQLIINDNSQEFSFSHLYNTGSIGIMAWKRFPHKWPYVNASIFLPLDSPHKESLVRSFDVIFVVSMNKLLIKTVLLPVILDVLTLQWCHCNVIQRPRYW